MSTEDQLKAMSKAVTALAADVKAIKHTLTALATSLGIADTVPELVAQLSEEERVAAELEKFEARRTSYIAFAMMGCNVHGRAARRDWLTAQLANHNTFGPIRPDDLVRWKLADDPAPT